MKKKTKIILMSLAMLIILSAIVLCLIFKPGFKLQENSSLTLQDIDKMSFDFDEIPSKKISKNIWEKEFVQINVNDIIFDEHWDKYIQLKSDYLMANNFIDLSELPNYFINNTDDYFAKKCYENDNADNTVTSLTTQDIKFAPGRLNVTTRLVKNNAYVTKIDFYTVVNSKDGGLDDLRNNKLSDNKFTLGNTYKEVSSILKNETKLFENKQGHDVLTYYRYTSDHVIMELQFTKRDKVSNDDAILTRIRWTPKTIAQKISQS